MTLSKFYLNWHNKIISIKLAKIPKTSKDKIALESIELKWFDFERLLQIQYLS